MDTYKAILKRRSIRRFKNRKVPISLLKKMVNAARLAPSAANMQPLEYFIVDKQGLCARIFKATKWASYTAPEGTPEKGCEPAAYIIILINNNKTMKIAPEKATDTLKYLFEHPLRDVGAAAENIMLTAESGGVASCWLGSIDREAVRQALGIPQNLEIDSLIALGFPGMDSKVCSLKDSVRYFYNRTGSLCVPKRPLKKVCYINKI